MNFMRGKEWAKYARFIDIVKRPKSRWLPGLTSSVLRRAKFLPVSTAPFDISTFNLIVPRRYEWFTWVGKLSCSSSRYDNEINVGLQISIFAQTPSVRLFNVHRIIPRLMSHRHTWPNGGVAGFSASAPDLGPNVIFRNCRLRFERVTSDVSAASARTVLSFPECSPLKKTHSWVEWFGLFWRRRMSGGSRPRFWWGGFVCSAGLGGNFSSAVRRVCAIWTVAGGERCCRTGLGTADKCWRCQNRYFQIFGNNREKWWGRSVNGLILIICQYFVPFAAVGYCYWHD